MINQDISPAKYTLQKEPFTQVTRACMLLLTVLLLLPTLLCNGEAKSAYAAPVNIDVYEPPSSPSTTPNAPKPSDAPWLNPKNFSDCVSNLITNSFFTFLDFALIGGPHAAHLYKAYFKKKITTAVQEQLKNINLTTIEEMTDSVKLAQRNLEFALHLLVKGNAQEKQKAIQLLQDTANTKELAPLVEEVQKVPLFKPFLNIFTKSSLKYLIPLSLLALIPAIPLAACATHLTASALTDAVAAESEGMNYNEALAYALGGLDDDSQDSKLALDDSSQTDVWLSSLLVPDAPNALDSPTIDASVLSTDEPFLDNESIT